MANTGSVFEYTVLLRPTEEEEEKGKLAELIVPPTHTVAKDEQSLRVKLIRQLDTKYEEMIDRVEFVIRPF